MNLTIRSKLIGGFAIILVLLISMLFFMVNKLSESNDRLHNIVEVYSKKINLSNDLMIAVLDIARNEKNIIMEKDIIQKEHYKYLIYKATETIEKTTIELQELAEGKGVIYLNEFITTWTAYKPYLNKIIALTMKDKNDEAIAISLEIGLKERNTAIGKLQRIIDKNKKSMEYAKIENSESYNAALNLIIALIISSILIAIIISYWIIQSVTKRIAVIAKEAEKIASREFSNEKLEDITNDELKPIFNSLVSVNESFREITENANKVASGDYTVNLTPRSYKDTLGNALNKMTQSLRETTEENKTHNWLAVGQNLLNEKLSGDKSIEELASNTISFLCTYLNANIGAVYLFNDKDYTLELCGQFAFASPKDIKGKFSLNEGLIGQAASEKNKFL